MARSPIYKRRKNNLKYWLLLLLAGVLGYFVLSQIKSFTPQDLVENSELRGREFVTLVQEIVSPRHKIKAYLLEDKANPIVSMNFVFRNAGYVSDDENRQGLAKLVAALLKEGAGKYDRQEIKEMLAVNAIDIKFKAEKDDFSILMKTTKANLDKTIKLLSLMLFQPRFDEEDILRIKAKFYEEIKKQEEFPTKVVEQEFAREVFSNHPYERNSLGIKDNIKQISQKDLFTFVKNSFSKDNLLAGIAGDISSKETEKILDELFGQLPQKGKIKFVRNAEVDFTKASKKSSKEMAQNIALLAMPSVGRNHADFYPLFVANHIFGGSGLGSKLSQEIREKRGLTYGIYSYMTLDDKSQLLMIGFAATKDNFNKANEILRNEISEFSKKGITHEELQKAKNYLIASYNLRFASIETIAQILTAMQKYNLGLDFLQKRNEYVRKVNLNDVNTVITKYFNSNNLVGVEVGKF